MSVPEVPRDLVTAGICVRGQASKLLGFLEVIPLT